MRMRFGNVGWAHRSFYFDASGLSTAQRSEGGFFSVFIFYIPDGFIGFRVDVWILVFSSSSHKDANYGGGGGLLETARPREMKALLARTVFIFGGSKNETPQLRHQNLCEESAHGPQTS